MVTISAERIIPGPPADAWYALTHAAVLHEWLCDFASVAPRAGGRVYLWWHDGGYVCGEFASLEPERSMTLSWHGRGDTAPGQVRIDLASEGSGTRISVRHDLPDGGASSGPVDDARVDEKTREWTDALGNLEYVLETGLDRRVMDRPLLGIFISDFNPDVAEALGVPVADGMRLDGVTEGLGAEAAGLRKGDVLVEMAGVPLRSDYGSLATALRGRRGGDRVQVVYYRGPERRTVTMELSRRPVPDVPRAPAALAEAIRRRKAEGIAALEACLSGVDEAAADRRPADGGWNAKEVLAHLVHGERAVLANAVDLIGGFERVADDYPGNQDAAVRATAIACGTVPGLIDELRRLAAEAEALAIAFPPEFVARVCAYIPAAQQLLDDGYHLQAHVAQIAAAVRGG